MPLSLEQEALLWCVRIWVAGIAHDIDAERRIHGVLSGFGAPDATPFLEGLMFAIGHGATRPIDVHCVCCPQVSPDERLVLDVVGMAQEMRPFEALLLLRGCLSPEGARAALRSAEGIGAALGRCGCFLPAPCGDAAPFPLVDGSSDLHPR